MKRSVLSRLYSLLAEIAAKHSFHLPEESIKQLARQARESLTTNWCKRFRGPVWDLTMSLINEASRSKRSSIWLALSLIRLMHPATRPSLILSRRRLVVGSIPVSGTSCTKSPGLCRI